MSELCPKCGEFVYVPDGLEFDEETDICCICQHDRIQELEAEVARLRAPHPAVEVLEALVSLVTEFPWDSIGKVNLLSWITELRRTKGV